MPRRHHPDPDIYDYRMPVGCMVLFGLPFLLGGLFAVFLSFTSEAGRRDMPDWYILLPGGLLLAGVGVLLVFTRRGTEIDRRNGRVAKWWRLLWLVRRTAHPLGNFRQVIMSQRMERGRRRSYTVYPVALGGGDARALEIDTKLTFSGADELAGDLARFTGFEFVDRSQGSPIVRLATEVDASLRERSEAGLQWKDLPEAPSPLRTRVEVLGSVLRLDIPRAGFGWRDRGWLVAGLLVPAGIYFSWLGPMWRRGSAPVPTLVALTALLVAMPFIVFYVPSVRGALRRTRVEASPQEIRVRPRGLFGRTRSLLSHRIKQINVLDEHVFRGEVEPRKGGRQLLVVRGDGGTLSFGLGLSSAELEWMRSVLWHVAAAQA